MHGGLGRIMVSWELIELMLMQGVQKVYAPASA